jgi:hypothetical protein
LIAYITSNPRDREGWTLLQSEIGVLIADSFYAELAASVKDVAAYALCGFIYYREICRGILEFGLQ